MVHYARKKKYVFWKDMAFNHMKCLAFVTFKESEKTSWFYLDIVWSVKPKCRFFFFYYSPALWTLYIKIAKQFR